MIQLVKWVHSYYNCQKIFGNTKKYQIPILGLSHFVKKEV